MASSLEEMRQKAAEKFLKTELPQIHLDCDGTEIDEDEYFLTLEAGTELVAVFPGEQWADVSFLTRFQFPPNDFLIFRNSPSLLILSPHST